MLISPLAARLCAARGTDPTTLRGTGPRGRIMAADVLLAGSAPQRRGGTTLADFSTPPTREQKDGYYIYDDEVDMSALVDISMPIAVQCEKLLENRYSLFDYIIRAVVKACTTCPSWQDPSGRIDVLLFEHKGEQITAISDAVHKSIYHIAIRPLTEPAYRQLGFVLRSRENASLAMKRFLKYLDARNDTQR